MSHVRSQSTPPADALTAPDFVALLRCPHDGDPLVRVGDRLVSTSGAYHYRIDEHGIPLFAEEAGSPDARAQQLHYDRVAAAYIENLGYPHTQEYSAYLDRALLEVIDQDDLGTVAEICCGRGEALRLVGDRTGRAVGLDVSARMLHSAASDLAEARTAFVQGDATAMPLASDSFDHVIVLGGIHHVNDRAALFSEMYRILKPGGRLVYREPVSDFMLWKLLRDIIYRLSPGLDYDTERPLTYEETVPVLEAAGFEGCTWQTFGFLGFCLFMNSDILVFNRLFRFVPGIRAMTRAACRFDDWVTRRKALRWLGLQVVETASKPMQTAAVATETP